MEMFAAEGLRTAFTRAAPPVAGLLPVARRRLERQRQFAHLLTRGGKKAAALAGWLDQAEDCIAALARPCAVLREVAVGVTGTEVELAGRVRLDDAQLARALAAAGTLTLSLVTLGYDQQRAFAWLQQDYGAHHIQSALARETLFALGRSVDDGLRAAAPGRRLVRLSLQTEAAACGGRRIWEPAQVQALLALFAGAEAPVTLNDAGCFQPLHSRLGLGYFR